MKIGVFGYGFVGGTVANTFFKLGHEVYVSDPYKTVPKEFGNNKLEEVKECPIIFIALPTVPTEDGKRMNLEPFHEVLSKLKDSKSMIIIKSTLLPGTTREFAIKYNLENLCFMPEFLTERTAMVDFMCPDRIVLGSVGRIDPRLFLNLFSKFDCPKVVTTAETAELLKFASNTFFATKVTFANYMFDVAKHYGVNWEEIKKILYLDKRIGNDHLTVYENNRGFGGHCLDGNTEIITNTCIKYIKDIKIGDYVLTHNGNFKKVTKLFKRKTNKLFELKVQGLNKVLITDEHPVFIGKSNRKMTGIKRKKLTNGLTSNLKKEWVEVKDIKKGDITYLPQINIKSKNSSNLEKDFARFIGYYTAEGNQDKGRIQLAFNIKEKEYHRDIEEIMKKLYNKEVKKTIRGNCMILRIYGNDLLKIIKENCDGKADTKIVNNNFIFGNIDLTKEFLKGFWRGDGSKSTGVYSMTTISKDLFNQLKVALLRFNIAYTTHIYNKRIDKNGVKHKQSYTIRIRNKTEIDKFNFIIEENLKKINKLERKTSWFENGFICSPIKYIKKINCKNKTVYNLEVEEDNSYVCLDLTVHNCLPKDLYQLTCELEPHLDVEFFKSILKENRKMRKNKKDWEA